MSRKTRIGITRDFLDKDGKFKLPGPGLRLLNEMLGVDYEVFSKYLPEVTPEQVQGFDMVITWMPRWTQRTILGNGQLLSIHRIGVGYDVIDVHALTNAGVMLCTTPSASRRPMAVAIITLILTLSTRLLDKHKLTREGRWDEKQKCIGSGLVGKTLGSIGAGSIGHEMFRLTRPFGMKHIATTRTMSQEAVSDVDVQLVDLETLLMESDFLNICCPLNKETYHLIGEKELRKMKKTAFLINTARGAIVDEAALIKALQQGWIQGAGIDVFEQEPTPVDNPLLKMDNVIVAPHALCWTEEYFENMWDAIITQASQIIRREVPEGVVNRGVWDKPEFQSKLTKF